MAAANSLLLYEHLDRRLLPARADSAVIVDDPGWCRTPPFGIDPALFALLAPAVGQLWAGADGDQPPGTSHCWPTPLQPDLERRDGQGQTPG